MDTKHKHYEYIVAFAEGKAVQYRLPQWSKGDWGTIPPLGVYMFDDSRYQFRIKPEERKTIGYRQYYVEQGGSVFLCILFEQAEWATPDDIEENTEHFIAWKHTEWQYDIVPEGK